MKNLYRKTYGVFGIVEYYAEIPLGSAKLKVVFEHGVKSSRGIEPATFSTSNPVEQLAIEQSNQFLSGKIQLIKRELIGTTDNGQPETTADEAPVNEQRGAVMMDDGEEAPSESEEDGQQSDTVKYPDVKNSQAAKEILMGEPYNVPLSELQNKQAILDKAAELKVEFPDWK